MAPKILFVVRNGALLQRGDGERLDRGDGALSERRAGALPERSDGALPEGRADEARDSLEALRLMEGVLPALLRLRGAGYEIVVLADDAPVQPSGREHQAAAAAPTAPKPAGGRSPGDRGSPADLGSVHDSELDSFLQALFSSQGARFSAVLRCPHAGPNPRCGCRRPGVELVRGYLAAGGMDRERSAVVGASGVDLEFAKNVGVRGFLLGGLAENRATSWADVAHALVDRPRTAHVLRKTRETAIEVEIDLDREAEPRVATGIGFFDHMLEQLGKHGGFDLAVTCRGDLEVDEHHTVEDVALALGQALRQALGDKRGIQRYGFVLPMDEAEAQVSIDLGGRPYLVFEGAFPRERVGGLPTELVPHFFRSLAESLGAALHVTLRGENAHHMVEAAFKGVARTLRQACARSGESLPTTKGVLRGVRR